MGKIGLPTFFSRIQISVLYTAGSADRTVKFFDLETFELIGSAGPEVST
jgi:WD40 repeat protein